MKPRKTVSESRPDGSPQQSEARGKVEGGAASDLAGTGWDDALESGLPTAGAIIGGRYRVERELGSGGMGVVVAARHLELGHRVAIKLLALGDSGASKRFLREARICAGLSSEHIVRVFDNGQLPSGTPYMVMEYLQGQDLREFMSRTGVSILDAILIARQLCAALSEAHAAGIVHRDLKPSNLFRVERSDGSALIKVLDFGISKVAEGPIGQTGSNLTQPGGFIGTQHYASPEQLTSSPTVDFRADIWGAGTILYELLTGTLAFPQEHFLACWAAIAEARFVPPRQLRPEIPAELEAIVLRCLRVDPNERFASSEELADALDAQLAQLEPGASAFDARSRRRDLRTRSSHSASMAPKVEVGAPPTAGRSPLAVVSAAFARTYRALAPRRVPHTSPLRGSMTPIALAAALGIAATGMVWGKLQDRFAGPASAPAVSSSENRRATVPSRDSTTVVHAVNAAPEPRPLDSRDTQVRPDRQVASQAPAVPPVLGVVAAAPDRNPTAATAAVVKTSRRGGGRSARATGHTEPAVANTALALEVGDASGSAAPTAAGNDGLDPGAAVTNARSEVPALRPRERAPVVNAAGLPSTTGPVSTTQPAYPYGREARPAAVYETSQAAASASPGYVMAPRSPVVVIQDRSPAPGVHVHVRSQRSRHYTAPARTRRSYQDALRNLHKDPERPRRRSR